MQQPVAQILNWATVRNQKADICRSKQTSSFPLTEIAIRRIAEQSRTGEASGFYGGHGEWGIGISRVEVERGRKRLSDWGMRDGRLGLTVSIPSQFALTVYDTLGQIHISLPWLLQPEMQ